MIEDLSTFGVWLLARVEPAVHHNYMRVVKQWSAFLDGREPTPETAIAYTEYLVSHNYAESTIIFNILPALRKYLCGWKGVDFDTLKVPGKEQARQYMRRHHVRSREQTRDWFRDKALCTKVNGKRTWITGLHKRPRSETCELCDKPYRKIDYHHWDSSNPSKGLWLCWHCHMFAEALEKGASPEKYMELKESVEQEATEAQIVRAKTAGTYLQREGE